MTRHGTLRRFWQSTQQSLLGMDCMNSSSTIIWSTMISSIRLPFLALFTPELFTPELVFSAMSCSYQLFFNELSVITLQKTTILLETEKLASYSYSVSKLLANLWCYTQCTCNVALPLMHASQLTIIQLQASVEMSATCWHPKKPVV